jgi:hypothetical protein
VRERIEHEVAAVVLKEFALQDAGMLGGPSGPGVRRHRRVSGQRPEILVRHLHQVAVDWVDHYKREQNPVGASS